MSYKVLGIGAPVIDTIMLVEEVPDPKGGMKIVDYQTLQKTIADFSGIPIVVAGGSAANTIKGLAHLGHLCALVGKIGEDDCSKTLLDVLSKQNIKTFYQKTSTPTGQIVCLVTPEGERTFCCYIGASGEMRPEELNEKLFTGVELVHIEGYSLLQPGLTETAMEFAKRAGAQVSFDLASFDIVKQNKERIVMLLAKYVDVLFANSAEARMLTGLDPESACSILKDLCGTAVVFIGDQGCWVGRGKEKIRCPAYPVKPLDTTGAGDLFASGFLHGYLNGESVEECARYGVVVSNAVVQVLGADIPGKIWLKIKADFGVR